MDHNAETTPPTQHDAHYTPPNLAKSLVEAASDLRPEVVADPAAGYGDLLFQAERVWPNATYIATDIDHTAIRRLAKSRPTWSVGKCDLRNPRSRSSCHALRHLQGSICLLLLNPPFSCRGGTRFSAPTQDGPIIASTAMSFLLLAAEYLAPHGSIVAILPLGCLSNDKDATAWSYLESQYNIELLRSWDKHTFPHSSASTVLVRLSPRLAQTRQTNRLKTQHKNVPRIHVQLVRGTCQVPHLNPDDKKPVLVHYTDIRNGSIVLNGRRGSGSHRCVSAPAVLLPRVGNITDTKIAILEPRNHVMLSDCVIAIKTKTTHHALAVRERLLNNFDILRANYTGTGAPFITIMRLKETLRRIAVSVG